MMYNQKLVAAIKTNGKPLREFGEEVFIPFGSEYSILIKNLNAVRVVARVYIDGANVTGKGDGGIVIKPNDEIDLERSLANGNNKKGNKFKFIERSAGVESHRGIKLEDGLLRIEYEFEKPYPKYVNTAWIDGSHIGSYGGGLKGTSGNSPNEHRAFTTSTIGSGTTGAMDDYSITTSCSAPQASGSSRSKGRQLKSSSREMQNDVGITVPGSQSKQKFQKSEWFPTENESHVIVLKLLGVTEDNKPVRKAVTTKAKPTCTTCARVNRATAKFCTECGTGLLIVA
jgi:hypothetical protein